MKVLAINGSPRSGHNTAKLLDAFLGGAASAGENVETRRIDLYSLNYKGCTECFGCKVKGSPMYGRCVYNDDIKELLWEVANADAVAFGSPVYFGDITGQLRCFLERLFYPFTAFKKDGDRVIAPKKVPTAFLYSMNAPEPPVEGGYAQRVSDMTRWAQHVLGYAPEVMVASNIWQMDDHDRYEMDIWDWEQKARIRDEQFPEDLKKAYEIGKKLVLTAKMY